MNNRKKTKEKKTNSTVVCKKTTRERDNPIHRHPVMLLLLLLNVSTCVMSIVCESYHRDPKTTTTKSPWGELETFFFFFFCIKQNTKQEPRRRQVKMLSPYHSGRQVSLTSVAANIFRSPPQMSDPLLHLKNKQSSSSFS